MFRMMLLLGALVVFGSNCLAAPLSDPGFIDGNRLLADCSKYNGSLESISCIGYTTGIADALDGATFCSPGNITTQQVKDVVTQWLGRHPESRQRSGAYLASLALKEAFPCR